MNLDHSWIIGNINVTRPKLIREAREVRNFRKIDVDKFFEDTNFHELVDNWVDWDCSLDDLLSLYDSKIRKALDKHAPTKIVKSKIKERQPWYTDELVALKRKLRNRARIWIKYRENPQLDAFKEVQHEYNSEIRKAKYLYISREIQSKKGDAKNLYKTIDGLIGRANENPMPPGLNDIDQSNKFADYFVDKIEGIRSKLEDYPKYVPKGKDIKYKLERFRQLDHKELCDIVMHLKTKSCELYIIPTAFLKKHIDEFLVGIGIIVNTSLEKGVFDTRWKTAIVRPLIKKINGELVRSNYRPVSNLSFISKVVVSAGMKQIIDHCNFNDLMPKHQSAYRPDYSCETVLLKIVNDILWNMEDKNITALVAMDLSASFDTVDHDILLKVLEMEFGITDTALNWCASYLCNRVFKVSIGKELSNIKAFSYSV